ncbi:MAG TPA: BamA/TamA family outer membrane protein [Fodinibius sp.]|nr:BamA/TamA family outer membrane protein [Fodinibius sp.]
MTIGLSSGSYAEGNRPDNPQVWKVSIKGNDTFSSVIIKDQIATEGYSFWEKIRFWNRSGHKLNEINIKKDVIRIRNYYHRRGFLNVKVQYQIKEGNKAWKKEVIFIIDEQQPIRIETIQFSFDQEKKYRNLLENDKKLAREKRRSEYQEGQRYETIKEPEVIGGFVEVLKNMGFPYAEVDISAQVDTARLAAELTIHGSLGPKSYFDHISVRGNKTISEQYVIRESGLKKGEQYSLDALQKAQREIFNHHLFRFVTIDIPEQLKDSTLNLDMQIRENELRTIKTSIGFGTEDYLRGQVSWIHRNAFGKGHQFSTTAKASFIEQTLSLDYLFPYVFNTKSSFVVSPFAQHLLEENYELTRYGLNYGLIYRYSRNLTGSISYQLTRNSEMSLQSDVSLPDTTQNYNLSSIQLSGYYNQSFSRRAQKGWVIQPYAEFSGFLSMADFSFQKISLDVRRYTPLTSTTTLAMRIQGGMIFATQEDSLPNNIRFYTGGTSSVRGWGRYQLGPKRVVTDSLSDENGNSIADSTSFDRYIPTGGRTFFSFNLEIRQDIDALINNFGLSAFLDGGQVWRKDPNITRRPLQFSIGGGIRYASPIGPVRLDVGYKLNPSDKDLNIYKGIDHGNAWDRIGIHISVGQSF